jgi:hypothetical protein
VEKLSQKAKSVQHARERITNQATCSSAANLDARIHGLAGRKHPMRKEPVTEGTVRDGGAAVCRMYSIV